MGKVETLERKLGALVLQATGLPSISSVVVRLFEERIAAEYSPLLKTSNEGKTLYGGVMDTGVKIVSDGIVLDEISHLLSTDHERYLIECSNGGDLWLSCERSDRQVQYWSFQPHVSLSPFSIGARKMQFFIEVEASISSSSSATLFCSQAQGDLAIHQLDSAIASHREYLKNLMGAKITFSPLAPLDRTVLSVQEIEAKLNAGSLCIAVDEERDYRQWLWFPTFPLQELEEKWRAAPAWGMKGWQEYFGGHWIGNEDYERDSEEGSANREQFLSIYHRLSDTKRYYTIDACCDEDSSLWAPDGRVLVHAGFAGEVGSDVDPKILEQFRKNLDL